jgi:hypothetical protein
LYDTYKTSSNTQKKMFGYLRSFVETFYTEEPVQRAVNFFDKISNYDVIETVNECGEKRYIEIPKNLEVERRKNLELLLTKCRKLLSFVNGKRYDEDMCILIVRLCERVKNAVNTSDDITYLFDEFRELESRIKKKSSRSFRNLSSLDIY